MTAVTNERVPQTIDAALIARAQGVYDNATGPGFRWSQESSEVTEALDELASALGFYRRIIAGDLTPEGAYEDLRLCQYANRPREWRLSAALRMAAEDAMAEAEEVVKVIAEVADGIAAEVRGEEGGEQ
jgi:hypothetical protein